MIVEGGVRLFEGDVKWLCGMRDGGMGSSVGIARSRGEMCRDGKVDSFVEMVEIGLMCVGVE